MRRSHPIPNIDQGETAYLGDMVIEIDFIDDEVYDISLSSDHLSAASNNLDKIPVEGSTAEIYIETAGFNRFLSYGANLVSFYTLPASNDIESMMQDVNSYVTQVIGASTASAYDGNSWIGSIDFFEESTLLLIRSRDFSITFKPYVKQS